MTPVKSGLLLIAASAVGLVLANSPWAAEWQALLHWKGLQHWINDGLMTLFFLLVGCEIKRELVSGRLSTASARWLPGLAAAGGMAVPALIYATLNLSPGGHPAGWAIPASTDIAFALGVLALLGSRVPPMVTVLLTAIAVLDDLGAVLIIALFYTGGLDLYGLGAVAVLTGLLVMLNRAGVLYILAYLGLGLLLWLAVFKSGLHATLAGVLLAATLPPQVARRVEHALHPVCAAFVVPVFGLANAGVALGGLSLAALGHPVSLGVLLGLFVGKPVGIIAGCLAAFATRLARRPEGVSWSQLAGMAQLCGIGFTMSLFVGLLAFASEPALIAEMKIGVLGGSLLSALAGLAVFLLPRRRARLRLD